MALPERGEHAVGDGGAMGADHAARAGHRAHEARGRVRIIQPQPALPRGDQRGRVVRQRGRAAAGALFQDAEVEQGHDVARVVRDRLRKHRAGAVEVAELQVQQAQVLARAAIARVHAQRLLEQPSRLCQAPVHERAGAQDVQRFLVVRRGRQQAAEPRFGLLPCPRFGRATRGRP